MEPLDYALLSVALLLLVFLTGSRFFGAVPDRRQRYRNSAGTVGPEERAFTIDNPEERSNEDALYSAGMNGTSPESRSAASATGSLATESRGGRG